MAAFRGEQTLSGERTSLPACRTSPHFVPDTGLGPEIKFHV